MAINDKDIKIEIGIKIKTFRKHDLKINREEFIDGVTDKYSSIENIECGRSMPDIDFMINMSNKFHEPVYMFVDTGFEFGREVYEEYQVDGYNDSIKLKIMQQVNIEKYCRLRGKPIEEFVNPSVENESLFENMGRLIHNERTKRGLSSSRLAADIGISRKSVMNLEKANNRMSMYTLFRICYELSLPMDYILVKGLCDKTPAIKYLLANTFSDADERERRYLLQYLKIVCEFYKK